MKRLKKLGEGNVKIENIKVEKMKKEEFENFGDVIEVEGEKMRIIKKGKNERYNDMERMEEEGKKKRVIINIFRGKYFEEKIDIMMMERNKLG